jgi:glycolate oxidase FAD binding subunit
MEVLGVSAAAEHAPASVAECGELLARGGRVAFVGGGTKLGLGRPPEGLDAIVRTTRLARVVEHSPADLVIVAEAGVTLARLQEVAGAHGQMLALDPPHPERATIGGLCATNAFGPRRARHGAPRDLVIGATLVRADGVVARGGGKVVKNVAGFDLPKLLCGSLGTLGLIATATFRLHPLPETGATAIAAGLSAGEVRALVTAIGAARLEPTSLVALAGAGAYDVAVRFEGFEQGVKQQLARLTELSRCEPAGDGAGFWVRHDAVRAGGPLRLRVITLPARLPALEAPVRRILSALRGGAIAWYATLGIGFVCGEPDDAPALAAAIEAARALLADGGGSLVVEEAPPAVRALVDPWGPPPASFPLMAELKRRFDPERRLNPGRFVGGL